jgi:hypothetical protein
MPSKPNNTTPSVLDNRIKSEATKSTSKGVFALIDAGNVASGSDRPQQAPKMNNASNGSRIIILVERAFDQASSKARARIGFILLRPPFY